MSSHRKSTISSYLSAPELAPSEPLYQVKLLSALRSGDPALIHPFLTEIGKEKRRSNTANSSKHGVSASITSSEDLDTGAAALHLAIRCASPETISLLLSHRAISPNGVHPPGSGTTALHLAASLGRADVVTLLLEQEGIDDTQLDNDGRTAKERGRSKEVRKAFDDSRAFLNASYRSHLRSYILSPPSAATVTASPSPAANAAHQALAALLSSPRSALIDLNYLDDASGSGLLHEAAKRRDLRLLELGVRAGADVFGRDRKGRLPGQGGGRDGKGDEKVKAFLRQLTNQDATLMRTGAPAAPGEPAVQRGFLNKYTNVAKGYNTRWFVLKDGVLSYYRHQEDEQFASRGSIAVRNCILKPPTSADRLRFEVHSGHRGGSEKWYMKASHPGEATRWVNAIEASIVWVKSRQAHGHDIAGMGSDVELSAGVASSASSVTGGERASISSSRQRLVSVLKKGAPASLSRRHTTDMDSLTSVHDSLAPRRDSGEGKSEPDAEGEGEDLNMSHDADAEWEDDEDEDGFNSSADSSRSQLRGKVEGPHEATFELLGNSATAQMELTLGLFTEHGPAREALKDALTMVNEYVSVSRERDAWWRQKLARAKAKQTAWEKSLVSAVREGEILERELRQRSRKRGSRFFDFDAAPANGTLKARSGRPSLLASSVVSEDLEVESPVQDVGLPSVLTAPPPPQQLQPQQPPVAKAAFPPPAPAPAAAPSPLVRSVTADSLPTPMTATGSTFAGRPYSSIGDAESVIDTDEEDEFFDAIEANTIPNLVVADALKSPAHSQLHLPDAVNVEPYAGYKTLRYDLNLSDARPSTSLWSVLKHSIGKDLTKISFPVFFNEPTSMLQRMAEDMEFSECLDVAAKERDAHRRIAFVAAFAMSNYSSTIGRIAKPFNPMLSETFEYVRIDKEYRYVSEQVSHHPPIFCVYGRVSLLAVDAQNKFMGKSFEIRPTGVAHADLLLPAEFAPSYPKAVGPFQGKVVEHYSWKKITNHRTKDTCILTFKPRGWRGKDAYEISGRVMDSRGTVTYEISGRWNSQLIARQVGTGSGALNPDLSVSGLNSPSATPEYILLWRNSEKIEGSPFNLTPFAITLNDCPKDTLKPYLCPTDCRLRPDQRAFEMGKYEIANTLKNDQEEKQRAIRKKREQGEMAPAQASLVLCRDGWGHWGAGVGGLEDAGWWTGVLG
ncbi:Oxysterol-binding protein-domain-containing protein [Roridomyces roridus]|uniref:Oxysterol-binding protein-domain-containing protein n=1 Tax=Roridomyces roridus TaxID=1738132 RepID=A0AAD7BDI6_9AGAR|nr:Oxysterol-binding protein-domain-containing protein [Roridomyces roridus]